MAADVLVSVVMAVHNGADQLPSTLQGILAQQQVNLECIVVDDGSSDASPELLQRLSAADQRIRVMSLPHGGLTRALIAGCAHARGELIARHDVGDQSAPQRLQMQRDQLMADPKLAFVACQHMLVGPAGEALAEAEPVDGGTAIIDSLHAASAADMCGPHHGSVMFRRSAYEAVGGYRSEFYFAQDLDLWSRLIEKGQLAFVSKPLYQVRFSTDSITSRYRDSQLALRALIAEATRRRRSGNSESEILSRAAAIRPNLSGRHRKLEADANYFIASCLYERRDPAADRYFRKVIRSEPLKFKAWMKMLGGWMRARS